MGYRVIRTNDYLYHHGIKGQKWGVKNGPPYPLDHKTSNSKSGIVKEAIRNGSVSTKVNPQKQAKHIKGPGYVEGRSYINGDLSNAQNLIDELSGTGEPIVKNGVWNHKEKVSTDRYIGVYVDPVTGEKTPTNNATIIYSKSGSHIYGRRK